MQDQFYLFTGPDGWVWVEMFWTDPEGDHHLTSATPFGELHEAICFFQDFHPHAVIDELCEEDIFDALRFTTEFVCQPGTMSLVS